LINERSFPDRVQSGYTHTTKNIQNLLGMLKPYRSVKFFRLNRVCPDGLVGDMHAYFTRGNPN